MAKRRKVLRKQKKATEKTLREQALEWWISLKNRELGFWIFWIGMALLATSILIFQAKFLTDLKVGKVVIHPLSFLALLELIYFYKSWSTLGPKRVGSKLVFGYPLYQVGPGPLFIPLGICSVSSDESRRIQVEVVGAAPGTGTPAPEVKTVNNVVMVTYQTEKFQVMFGSEKSVDDTIDQELGAGTLQALKDRFKEDEINARQTWDPRLVFSFRIGHHPTFLHRVGSIQQAVTYMGKAAIAEVQRQTRNLTPALFLDLLPLMNKRIRQAIEWEIGERGAEPPEGRKTEEPKSYLGIDLETAEIPLLGPPRRISEAQADRGKNRALIASKRFEGEGEGAKQKAVLIAVGEGQKQVQVDTLLTPEQQLAADVAKAVSQAGNVIVVGEQGMASL